MEGMSLMSKMKKILFVCLSIPKTVIFNLKAFPFSEAIKLKVFCAWNVKFKGLKRGSIEIEQQTEKFGVKFGNGGSDGIPRQKSAIILSENGKMVFKGKANFGEGVVIRIDGGIIEFGERFRTNKNAFVACNTKMSIGDDVLLGWNVNIRDSDGHNVYTNGVAAPKEKSVVIGNHVWICSYADILKGTVIGNDCVVAYRSCVAGGKHPNNSLIAGIPGKVIKEDINWVE